MFYVTSVTQLGAHSNFTSSDFEVAQQTYELMLTIADTAYVQFGGVGTGIIEHKMLMAFIPDWVDQDEQEAFKAALDIADTAGDDGEYSRAMADAMRQEKPRDLHPLAKSCLSPRR